MSQLDNDGVERPVAFVSRALSTCSRKNYTQIECEALSIIFGVHKFYQYLYGWEFMPYTEYKPLTLLLEEK